MKPYGLAIFVTCGLLLASMAPATELPPQAVLAGVVGTFPLPAPYSIDKDMKPGRERRAGYSVDSVTKAVDGVATVGQLIQSCAPDAYAELDRKGLGNLARSGMRAAVLGLMEIDSSKKATVGTYAAERVSGSDPRRPDTKQIVWILRIPMGDAYVKLIYPKQTSVAADLGAAIEGMRVTCGAVDLPDEPVPAIDAPAIEAVRAPPAPPIPAA